VYLVDGTYELFRAYYAVPSTKNQAGQEVGAARGLLSSLLALIRDHRVAYVACAFDHVIESFRNELFDGYKTSAGVEPELLDQFSLAESVSRALGIVTWPMVEFEADDALATAAARLALDPRVAQVVICSPDKDLAQCVAGDRVVLYDRQRDRVLDEAGVVEKFGVGPSSIPDYLALVGDSADGIPGVRRWGAKSAAALLREYGSLDEIPPDPKRWAVRVRGAEALAEALEAARHAALLFRKLTVLRTDVPLAVSLLDLRLTGAPARELSELSNALGDPGLPEKVSEVLRTLRVAAREG
jgi:5'-3' exonuclease